MKHEEIPEKAADLYLMNELPAADRDAFQEHLSECDLCKTQVRAGEAFRELLSDPREVPVPIPVPMPVRQQRPVRSRWHLSQLLPAAATFLIAISGMQVLVVQPLMRAQAMRRLPVVATAVIPLRQQVRSENPAAVEVDNSHGPSILNVDVVGDGRSTVYTYTITGGIRPLYTRTIAAKDVNGHDSVLIVLQQGTLPPGDYTLRIDTKPRISTYLFRVRSD